MLPGRRLRTATLRNVDGFLPSLILEMAAGYLKINSSA